MIAGPAIGTIVATIGVAALGVALLLFGVAIRRRAPSRLRPPQTAAMVSVALAMLAIVAQALLSPWWSNLAFLTRWIPWLLPLSGWLWLLWQLRYTSVGENHQARAS